MVSELPRWLSLGAGVQSTAVILMSRDGVLPSLDGAIFSDTGWEPKAVYGHLEWLEGEIGGEIPIHRVSAGNIKEDALRNQVRGKANKETGERWASMPYRVRNEDGSTGMIRRQCTREYKIDPIEKFLRGELGLKKGQRFPDGPVVEQWMGISTDEIRRARISEMRWKKHEYPLIYMRPTSRAGCLKWMREQGYPEPPRSACIACPFKSPLEWRQLRDTSPEEWQEAVAFDEAIRKCGGMRGDVFVHRDAVPLKDADLSVDTDHGQRLLWGTDDECMGMCGV